MLTRTSNLAQHVRIIFIPLEPRFYLRLFIAIAFDVHLGEIMGSWKYGYRICTAHRSELLENLAYAVETIGITHIMLVPSLMEAVILPIKHELPIKFIGSGGEKLSDAVCLSLHLRTNSLKSFRSGDRMVGFQAAYTTHKLLRVSAAKTSCVPELIYVPS